MINKAILVGRLGREPEYRASQSGKASCRFSLATDSGYGQSRKTDWHSIVCFDKQAEFARDYLHKGSLVYIEGRISYGEYEKDGVKHKTVDILASTVQSLGGRNDSPNAGGSFDSNRGDSSSYSQNSYSQNSYSQNNYSALSQNMADDVAPDGGNDLDEASVPF